MFFADATTGSHIASASALKNQYWSTVNCVFNWAVQGIWPDPRTDTTIESTARSKAETVVLSGDNYGNLKMFRYPCAEATGQAPYKLFTGHSREIKCLEFSQNDGHAFSVGSVDRSIFQWHHLMDEVEDESHVANLVEDDSDLEIEGLIVPTHSSSSSGITTTDDSATFVPVKSYLSAMIPPTNPAQERLDAPPDLEIDMDHVHGYRSHDVRHNLFYTVDGRVVYHTGGIGVSYDRNAHRQAHYRGHAPETIVSLAISLDGRFVVTGEATGPVTRPRIHLWDALSCAPVSKFPTFHERAITSLSFSPCRTYLASVGQDENHSVAVWHNASSNPSDWRLAAHAKNTSRKVLFVLFCRAWPAPSASASALNPPKASDLTDYDVVTGGINHVTFWKLDGPTLIALRGVFGSRATRQPIPCAALVHQRVVTGTATGHLYVWEGRGVTRILQGHAGTVNSIYATQPRGDVGSTSTTTPTTTISLQTAGCVTGGRDGHVKLWARDMTPLADFDMGSVATPTSFNPVVRSVCWDATHHRILVGTRAAEIYELSTVGGRTLLLHEGHCDDQLFGLVTHPTNPDLYATGGDDKTIRIWSVSKRAVVAKTLMDTPVKALAWSPDGSVLAAGLGGSVGGNASRKDGAFAILDAATLEIVHEGRDSKKALSVMAFSPDGALLAIGSHDNVVYLYAALDNYKLRARQDKATGHISHVDFSTDGAYLRVNSDAFELLFINTQDGSWVPSPATMKDVSWQTQTCVLSWAVQGVWPSSSSGSGGDTTTADASSSDSYIHATDRANQSSVVVSGDHVATLRFHHYPVLSKDGPHHRVLGHSHSISNVEFTKNDEYLVSMGSVDRSIVQWKLDWHHQSNDEKQLAKKKEVEKKS